MRFCSLKLILPFLLFCMMLLFPLVARPEGGDLQILTTSEAHHRRISYLFTPSKYDDHTPMPLVMAFHGYLGSSEQMMRMTDFNDLAEKEGFIVIYPEALHEKWNANLGKSEASEIDVDYVRTLIAQVQSMRRIDSSRIYATGFSSGGFFSQRLACEMPDKIAAVAVVGSTIGQPLMHTCKLTHPIPFMAINGILDPIITWDGRIRKVRYAFKDASITSVPGMMRFWKGINGCQDLLIQDIKSSTNPPGPKVTLNHYYHCNADTTVDQVVIYQGGHTWPGSKVNFLLAKHVLGYTSKDVNASQFIWNFFKEYSLNEK